MVGQGRAHAVCLVAALNTGPLLYSRIEVDDRTEAYLRVLQQKVTSDTQIVSSRRSPGRWAWNHLIEGAF